MFFYLFIFYALEDRLITNIKQRYNINITPENGSVKYEFVDEFIMWLCFKAISIFLIENT